MRDCVSDTFEKLALLATQYWHWVLGQSKQHSLVAETLVSQILEICVFFEFDELFDVVLVQRICRLQTVHVHVSLDLSSSDSTAGSVVHTEVLRGAPILLQLLLLLSLLKSVGLGEASSASAFPSTFVL